MDYAEHSYSTPNRTPARKQYTPGFKADIVRRIEKGDSVCNVAREMNLNACIIYRWIENKKASFQNESQVSPRIVVNAKGAKYPQIDSELFDFVRDCRHSKLPVSTVMVQRKALELAETHISDVEERKKFKASTTYIGNFMRRNYFSYRKATHVSQYKIENWCGVKTSLINYLARLRKFLSQFPCISDVLQCDETPVYFDMANPRTIEFKGTKTVDLLTTGHTKTRFTCLLTLAAHGQVLECYVVFRGLKNVPNCHIPENIIVNVNESGTMNRHLMLDYMRRVVYRYLGGRNGGLIMDSFRAHFVEEVVDYMDQINVKGFAILAGHTDKAQPCDVVVNKPFKQYMREEWEAFINEPTVPADFTKGGNRKRPSYERILGMVSRSVGRLNANPEMIQKVLIIRFY
jgi:transposase-like protein